MDSDVLFFPLTSDCRVTVIPVAFHATFTHAFCPKSFRHRVETQTGKSNSHAEV